MLNRYVAPMEIHQRWAFIVPELLREHLGGLTRPWLIWIERQHPKLEICAMRRFVCRGAAGVSVTIERGRVPTLAMSLDPVPAYGKKWIVVSVNHPSDFIKVLREQLR